MSKIQIQGLNEFSRYKSLLSELVRKNVKIKYRNSILGVLWSFLDPLLHMVVMTIVFSQLFRRVPDYPIYYLTGQLTLSLFTGGSTQAMNSLLNSSAIWKSIYVPKYLYALAAVLSNFVTFALSLIVLFAIMIILGKDFTVFMIFASLPILVTLVLTFGAGLIVGTLNIIFRDVQHLYNVFCLMLLYATPIFYPADIIPAQYKFIHTLNPMYYLVTCMRHCFYIGDLYSLPELLIPAAAAVVILIIGLLMLRRYQDKFILYL